MAGNSEGAKKAAQTARERHGKDFHAKAASKSWNNPNRSRKVGFATMDPDTHKNVSAKGGKNKHDKENNGFGPGLYEATTSLQEATNTAVEAQEAASGTGE